MSVGLGFFCSTSRNELTTNRVLRLRNLSGENVLRIFEKNLEDFKALLKMSCSMGFVKPEDFLDMLSMIGGRPGRRDR
ncbi:MAG: hypothetical protein QW189_07745 [Thermofilaceae archaeon]